MKKVAARVHPKSAGNPGAPPQSPSGCRGLPEPHKHAATASRRIALLKWYDLNKRTLPWRGRSRRAAGGIDPWAVWVSEVMLQQTPVRRVVPYFERFIRRFPDPSSLAAATEEEALSHWSGLGYYSRGRKLRKGAGLVAERLREGRGYPASAVEWSEIPGVGDYTAAAIASIAFGQAVPVVDGNVARVAARLLARRVTRRQAVGDPEIRGMLHGLIDRRRPGDFNQAMMELGATTCHVESPSCSRCPLASVCRAHQLGRPESYPSPERSPRPTRVVRAVAFIIRSGDELLLCRRSPSIRGLLLPRFNRGLWEPPTFRLGGRMSPEGLLGNLLGTAPKRTGGLASGIRHTITHHRISVDLAGAETDRTPCRPKRGARLKWITLSGEEDSQPPPLSGLARKIIQKFKVQGSKFKVGRSR